LHASSDVAQSVLATSDVSGELSEVSSFDSDPESDHEGEYEVEKILGRRHINRFVEYFVAWKGYSAKANSWEPHFCLTAAKKAIFLFNSAQKKCVTGIPQPSQMRKLIHQ
jgi:hypothetical protein